MRARRLQQLLSSAGWLGWQRVAPGGRASQPAIAFQPRSYAALLSVARSCSIILKYLPVESIRHCSAGTGCPSAPGRGSAAGQPTRPQASQISSSTPSTSKPLAISPVSRAVHGWGHLSAALAASAAATATVAAEEKDDPRNGDRSLPAAHQQGLQTVEHAFEAVQQEWHRHAAQTSNAEVLFVLGMDEDA